MVHTETIPNTSPHSYPLQKGRKTTQYSSVEAAASAASYAATIQHQSSSAVHFADEIGASLMSPQMAFSPGPNFNGDQLSVNKFGKSPMMTTPYSLRATPARFINSSNKATVTNAFADLKSVFGNPMTPGAGMTPLVPGVGAARTPMDSTMKKVLLGNTGTPLNRTGRGTQIDMSGEVFSPALSDISVTGLFDDSEKENVGPNAGKIPTPTMSNQTPGASKAKSLSTIKEDLSQSQSSAASILSTLSPGAATMNASQVSEASSSLYQTNGTAVSFGNSSSNNVLMQSMPPPCPTTAGQDKNKTPFVLAPSADLTPDSGTAHAMAHLRRNPRRESVKLSVSDLLSPNEASVSGSGEKRKLVSKIGLGESLGEMNASEFDQSRSLPAKKRKFAPVVSGMGGRSEVN